MAESTVPIRPCGECERPMVAQSIWRRVPAVREGRVVSAAYGLCGSCYSRAYRAGTLPVTRRLR